MLSSHAPVTTSVFPVVASAAPVSLDSRLEVIREVIREVVKEELQNLLPAADRPRSLSIAEDVREEIWRAVQPELAINVAAHEEPTLSYAAMA